MPFNYKNPISPEQLNGVQSVVRSDTQGTNFSILGVGGFVEVYNSWFSFWYQDLEKTN